MTAARQETGRASILETILAHKREEVRSLRDRAPDLSSAPPPRDFPAALQGDCVRLIAEVKKASPSRGVLRPDFDPVRMATGYEAHGAAAISVLTDERFFQGAADHLAAVRAAVAIPVLRKEFIIDPWQVVESRSLGADAVLLIAAILDDSQLADFARLAGELGMAALVEVHTEGELDRALACGAPVIGINNRDLNTFATTLETTERLGPRVKAAGRVLVSESGIFTGGDVARAAAAGADAVFVGEALVTADQPGALTRELSAVRR